MMEQLIAVAYNTALQRLDRAMMGNSINYRTPFLDSEVTAFCLQIPVDWKVHKQPDGQLVEKWLLREAFKDMLPEEIYRREKLRFSGGTGTDPLIEEMGREIIEEGAFTEDSRQTPGGYMLNSPKELAYYRLFKEYFPDPAFESLVGRWDPEK
jgi:asparagine synthase (glutamine-hydrolysing)